MSKIRFKTSDILLIVDSDLYLNSSKFYKEARNISTDSDGFLKFNVTKSFTKNCEFYYE